MSEVIFNDLERAHEGIPSPVVDDLSSDFHEKEVVKCLGHTFKCEHSKHSIHVHLGPTAHG